MQSRHSEKQAAEKKERKKGTRLIERQTVLQFALQTTGLPLPRISKKPEGWLRGASWSGSHVRPQRTGPLDGSAKFSVWRLTIRPDTRLAGLTISRCYTLSISMFENRRRPKLSSTLYQHLNWPPKQALQVYHENVAFVDLRIDKQDGVGQSPCGVASLLPRHALCSPFLCISGVLDP